jgi:hypothetical protein
MPPPKSVDGVSSMCKEITGHIPLASFCSHVREEKTRKPDSRATEKHELSAFRDTERTKGPASESRIGRVFILTLVAYSSVLRAGPGNEEVGAFRTQNRDYDPVGWLQMAGYCLPLF